MVNNLIYYVNLIDEFWDKSDEYTISISMNNNGKLVFWDIQTPVGKSKILRRPYDFNTNNISFNKNIQ